MHAVPITALSQMLHIIRRVSLRLAFGIGTGASRSAVVPIIVLTLAGCTGSGRIELAALDYTSIDPPSPRASVIDIDQAYWWTDEHGHVWVALARRVELAFIAGARFEIQISLLLEKPPSGKARNYVVGKREMRGTAVVGPVSGRFAATRGIVALYREDGERMRGSFRLAVTREVSQLLGGWGRPSGYLLTGDFVALHDEVRGRAIAIASEATGLEREQPGAPTTMPVGPQVAPTVESDSASH